MVTQVYDAVTLFYFRNVDVTRKSAISDKPGDAFRGQSRSPNMVHGNSIR